MSRRLRVGDRVRAIVEGRPCPGDLGVVASIERRLVRGAPTGPQRAIVAWDTGEVDQVTRIGRPDGSCGEIGVQRTGGRWSREDARQLLARCLTEPA